MDPTVARSIVGNKGGRSISGSLHDKERSPHRLPTDRVVTTERSVDTVDLERGPEWLPGGERYKWSGFTSRDELLHARREAMRAMARRRVDRRMRAHVRRRNAEGANLPTPYAWHLSAACGTDSRHQPLKVNADGILSTCSRYS